MVFNNYLYIRSVLSAFAIFAFPINKNSINFAVFHEPAKHNVWYWFKNNIDKASVVKGGLNINIIYALGTFARNRSNYRFQSMV